MTSSWQGFGTSISRICIPSHAGDMTADSRFHVTFDADSGDCNSPFETTGKTQQATNQSQFCVRMCFVKGESDHSTQSYFKEMK